jgi:hypothetical protein
VGALWRAEGSVEPVYGASGQLTALLMFVAAAIVINRGRRNHAYDFRRFL